MKKSLLAIAIKSTSVLAIAALCAQAFAAPEIYGQVRLSALQKSSESKKDGVVVKGTDRANLSSALSRIGFTGKEKLTDNTDLEYRLEYGVDVAESTTKNFAVRHGYLALDNKQYGKLLVGRTLNYDDNLSAGSAWLRNVGIGPDSGHSSSWVNPTVLYTSPKFNNDTTQAFVQYGIDQNKDANKGPRTFTTFDKNGVEKEVQRDFVVGGVTYEKGDITLNGAYTRAGHDLNSILGSGSYRINDQITAQGQVQYTDFNSKNKEFSVLGEVDYKVSEPLLAWVTAYHTDNYKGYANGKASGINVGGKYDLNKALFAFASVGYGQQKYSTTDTKEKGIEIGTVYKF